MKNFNWKKAAVFVGAVVGALFIVKLVKTYLLPKAPAAVQQAANKVLPNT